MEHYSEKSIKNQHELYNRLNNEDRKKLLIFLYEQPRNYKELSEYSGLKPGSLYHHLGVLDPLIEKYDHGQYRITDLGMRIMESLDLISPDSQRPRIDENGSKNQDPPQFDGKNNSEKEVLISDSTTVMVNKSDNSNTGSNHSNLPDFGSTELLYHIWLSPSSYLLLSLSIIVIILLGFQGVAFAGSAIYTVGDTNPFLVDIVAIILGIGALLVLEDLFQQYPIYDQFRFISIIRIISMLPSLVIGITLLLLFMTGVVPPQNSYPIIFVLGIIMGTIAMMLGIHYLRAKSIGDALLYAIVPSSIDLLIGVVILLSV